ncbi:hypothetical protein ARMGADRAFT_1089834 [Armillaria gallica]|uniref:Uncharacterized protein n=1 Tax=Armillaria gallica TaxID=47427 RepID=A0A2H3CIM2_ARMGA|nr:hypothetical protein ARMGADRAFT_1089834 [Armillaria gallica]
MSPVWRWRVFRSIDDIPQGEDGMRWCKEKRIIIHGFDIGRPGYCIVDMNHWLSPAPTNLRIFGHWTVDFNEPSCKTLWENFQDKDAWRFAQRLAILKLIWVITNRHGIFGGRCAPLPPQTMMGIISINPVAVTTG